MKHNAEHDERLAAALERGDGDRDPKLARTLAECVECARTWSAMHAAAHALDTTRVQMREDLRAAALPGPAPGGARVRATLFAAAQAGDRASRTERPRRWNLALAAGLLLALAALVIALASRRSQPPVDSMLLGGEFGELAPRGDGARFDEFTWKHALAPQGWYELEIQGRSTPDGAWQPLGHGAGRLRASSWSPAAEMRAGWPRHLRWRVVARAPGGDPLASEWVEATRAP